MRITAPNSLMPKAEMTTWTKLVGFFELEAHCAKKNTPMVNRRKKSKVIQEKDEKGWVTAH